MLLEASSKKNRGILQGPLKVVDTSEERFLVLPDSGFILKNFG